MELFNQVFVLQLKKLLKVKAWSVCRHKENADWLNYDVGLWSTVIAIIVKKIGEICNVKFWKSEVEKKEHAGATEKQ